MRPQSPEVFLGRQPILNQQGLVSHMNCCSVRRPGKPRSTSPRLPRHHECDAHAFCHFGSSTVVGESKAFINFNAQLLMSNVIEALPRDRVVIELLETVDID